MPPALALFRRVAEIKPAFYAGLLDVAQTCMSLGRKDEAIREGTKALVLSSGHPVMLTASPSSRRCCTRRDRPMPVRLVCDVWDN